MDRYLQNMGQKNKSKAPPKTPRLAALDQGAVEEASPPCTRDNSLTHQAEEVLSSEYANDDFQIDYKRLAIEVTTRISPDIQETLAGTVTNMFTKMQVEVAQHSQRLEDLESRLLTCETITAEMLTHIQLLRHDNKRLREQVVDLENRSRRNNLRILGLHETVLQNDLIALCEKELPEALELQNDCKVERAHRLGPDFRSGKKDQNATAPRPPESPRQVIDKYLDYIDKMNTLRTFKSLRSEVKIRDHKILIFGDFSAELTQKRRAFSAVCSNLFRKQTQFALLYPAILKVFHKDGPPTLYRTPEEAMSALNIDTSTRAGSPSKVDSIHPSSTKAHGKVPTDPKAASSTEVSPPQNQRKRQAYKLVN